MNSFAPFTATDPGDTDADTLSARFSDEGYLFLPGLIEKAKIDRVRQLVVEQLRRHGYVRPGTETVPVWSGKAADGDDLLPDGPVISDVAASGVLGELSRAGELVACLGTTLGGPIFPWKDADARLRIMLQDTADHRASGTGPQFAFSTPAHQDYYFFRPVRFCTVWIPLMDIDQTVGGLSLRAGSHREGLHQIWWKKKEFLGIATSADQARQWASQGAVAVAGATAPPASNTGASWLRSNLHAGDALVFDALMMHAGVPNHSELVRLSVDFRYQKLGTTTHWESTRTMADSSRYFSTVLRSIDELDLGPGLYEHVWESMRLAGPSDADHQDVFRRVEALAKQLQTA